MSEELRRKWEALPDDTRERIITRLCETMETIVDALRRMAEAVAEVYRRFIEALLSWPRDRPLPTARAWATAQAARIEWKARGPRRNQALAWAIMMRRIRILKLTPAPCRT